MTFQKQVFKEQGVGSAGQIAKALHSYSNVESYVAGDSIAIGEFAQSSTTDENEAKSTKGKRLTGEILGVVVRDNLKATDSAEPKSTIETGEPLQIVNIGSVFIESENLANVGDYVIIDKTNGNITFSAVEPSGLSAIKTGWRVFLGNDYTEGGIVGITTAKSAGVKVAGSAYSAGDLVMKDLSVIKKAEVTAGDLDNALGVLVFAEGKMAMVANLDYDTGIKFCADTATWNSGGRTELEKLTSNPASHSASNAGGNALGWWEDLMPSYRAGIIATGKIDDLDDPSAYPAFYKAKEKGEGWYIPSAYALAQIARNTTAINETLAVLSKTALNGSFWTATSINEAGGYFWRNVIFNAGAGIADDVLTRLRENDVRGAIDGTERTNTRNLITVKAVKLN